MALIIKDGRQLFLSKKLDYLSIIKDILKKITKEKHLLILDLDIDTMFKVVWEG